MYEDSMSSSQTALSIALGGVVVHTVYFQRYEYHRHLYSLLGISFAITAFYPYFLYRWLAKSPADSIYIATFHGGSLVGGAVLSTILYRLFLSPLNRFPGPFSARLTDFWLAFHVGKKLNQYQRLQDLHRFVLLMRYYSCRMLMDVPDDTAGLYALAQPISPYQILPSWSRCWDTMLPQSKELGTTSTTPITLFTRSETQQSMKRNEGFGRQPFRSALYVLMTGRFNL